MFMITGDMRAGDVFIDRIYFVNKFDFTQKTEDTIHRHNWDRCVKIFINDFDEVICRERLV